MRESESMGCLSVCYLALIAAITFNSCVSNYNSVRYLRNIDRSNSHIEVELDELTKELKKMNEYELKSDGLLEKVKEPMEER